MRRGWLLVSCVIVQYDPYSKTGNRLCQYAFGKILSLRKNVPLYCTPIPGFSETYNYTPKNNSFTGAITTRLFGDHYVDYNSLLETKEPIVVNSYLQKYEYYTEYIELLRSSLLHDKEIKQSSNDDELVIHIRGTDYRNGNVHIEDQVYFEILNELSFKKMSIVTDDIDLEIVKQLCYNGASLITLNNTTNRGNGLNEYEMHDFVYMLSAKNLLISQSTFSWWAAFLGKQQNVYVPYDISKNCMWKLTPGKDDIDLIPNQNKFKKLIYENNKRI